MSSCAVLVQIYLQHVRRYAYSPELVLQDVAGLQWPLYCCSVRSREWQKAATCGDVEE